MTLLYPDVSQHDRVRRGSALDWTAIRQATGGTPIMCARATYGDPEGLHYPTAYFGEHIAGAKAAGYTWRGAYHNLVRGDRASINRQVDWVRRTRDAAGANWVMFDIEPYSELITQDMWPRWDDILEARDRWYAVESDPCAWYIAEWFWDIHTGPDLGEPDLRLLPGPLVQAHYAGGDGTAAQIYAAAGGDKGTGWDDLYGNRLPEIWQYTSSADVAGATGNTDMNAFKGSVADFAAMMTGGTDVPLTDADTDAVATKVWFRDTDPDDKVVESAWVALHNIRTGVAALAAKLDKLPAAISAVDEAVGQQLADDFAALGKQVGGVPQATVDALGAAGLSAQEAADLLRPLLGDKAAEVGALLTAG